MYKDAWNVIGADIFNEPHSATWGSGDENTDFQMWAETIGNYIHSLGVNWIINVQGVANNAGGCKETCMWGENLVNAGQYPVNLNQQYKLIYSPHDYGPSSQNQSYFYDPNFPNNINIMCIHFMTQYNLRVRIIIESIFIAK